MAASDLIWSYSQHFHAEARGEEVIEHLLAHSHKSVQRKMLGAQLLDERKHVDLFTKVTNRLGLDRDADSFARGYVAMIHNQAHLSEKIFCFQILTESVSAAFCRWRLSLLQDDHLKAVDSDVLKDEERHLGMGRCLLSICDQDEVSGVLTADRRRILVREMAAICNESLALSDATSTKALTRFISKSLISEAKQVADS